MNRTILGMLLAGATGLLWAISSPSSKLLGMAGVDMGTSAFCRIILVTLCVGPWLFLRFRDQLKIGRNELWKIFIFSVLGPVGLYIGFTQSVVYLNVATALVLHYTYPVITALGSSLVTGEHPSRYDILGACIVTVGVGCSVLGPDWHLDTSISIPGILWGLVAISGLAGQTLLGRACVTRGGLSPMAFFFYSHVMGIFWITLYKHFFIGWHDLLTFTPRIWVLIVVPAFIACVLGYVCYYQALRFIPAPTASLMASVEIFGAVILTSLATHSWPTVPEVLGCVLIFTAIFIVFLGHRQGEIQGKREATESDLRKNAISCNRREA